VKTNINEYCQILQRNLKEVKDFHSLRKINHIDLPEDEKDAFLEELLCRKTDRIPQNNFYFTSLL
jgi:hypothetical protein